MDNKACEIDLCIEEGEEVVLLECCEIKGHDLISYKDKSNIVYDINFQAIGRLDGNKIIYFTFKLAYNFSL